MIKTIKLYQIKALVNHHDIDNLVYADYISYSFKLGTSGETIFKTTNSKQLYTFSWGKDTYSKDIYAETVNGSIVNIYKYSNIDNCLVRVCSVTAKTIRQVKALKETGSTDLSR